MEIESEELGYFRLYSKLHLTRMYTLMSFEVRTFRVGFKAACT